MLPAIEHWSNSAADKLQRAYKGPTTHCCIEWHQQGSPPGLGLKSRRVLAAAAAASPETRNIFDQAKQHICGQSALVGLVNHHHTAEPEEHSSTSAITHSRPRQNVRCALYQQYSHHKQHKAALTWAPLSAGYFMGSWHKQCIQMVVTNIHNTQVGLFNNSKVASSRNKLP
jgi:hypothetical protein